MKDGSSPEAAELSRRTGAAAVNACSCQQRCCDAPGAATWAARGALSAAGAHRDPEISRRATKVLLALDAARAEAAEEKRRAEVPRPVDPKRLAKLIEQLGDEEMTKRAGAEAELKRIGEPAL